MLLCIVEAYQEKSEAELLIVPRIPEVADYLLSAHAFVRNCVQKNSGKNVAFLLEKCVFGVLVHGLFRKFAYSITFREHFAPLPPNNHYWLCTMLI